MEVVSISGVQEGDPSGVGFVETTKISWQRTNYSLEDIHFIFNNVDGPVECLFTIYNSVHTCRFQISGSCANHNLVGAYCLGSLL